MARAPSLSRTTIVTGAKLRMGRFTTSVIFGFKRQSPICLFSTLFPTFLLKYTITDDKTFLIYYIFPIAYRSSYAFLLMIRTVLLVSYGQQGLIR